MSQSERKLAATMYTDMVGYTALGQRNESLPLARGLARTDYGQGNRQVDEPLDIGRRVHSLRSRAFMAALGIIVLGALVALLLATGMGNPRLIYPTTASSDNSTLGITFTLALNSSRFRSGEAVNIKAFETNDLSTPNNLTQPANPWPGLLSRIYQQASIARCFSFTNALVFRGFCARAH